ncbi:uncharacterized protein AB675_10437 [Cyphellophora attinorum]|uniref:Uncharacterized protein n=1 Tax=Cyphellophora attinorum TaxID=1664694 RepID=A0A0N0NIJ6_9EURO|nr:uncharacterized protein AB675_10437 [Phialophora attinorum]KPI35911.1 hypothetical protein AB675_10437 [Phialophora attinorum]
MKLSTGRGLVEERDELDVASYRGNGYIEDLADHMHWSGQLSPDRTVPNGRRRNLIRYTAGTGFRVDVTAELRYEQLICSKVDSPIAWRNLPDRWPAPARELPINEEAIYLHQVCSAAAISHVLCVPYHSSMVLLSSSQESRSRGSVFDIRGRIASDEGDETRHVLLEIYGPNGLPGISLETSEDGRKKFLVTDLRSAVLLFGLPTRTHLRHLRMDVLDVLHDPTSFPIGPVRFDRFKYPAELHQPYTIERTMWLPPGSRVRTHLDVAFDGSQVRLTDPLNSENMTYIEIQDTRGNPSDIEN